MLANANQAATSPQATQIALADLLGRNYSNRRSSHITEIIASMKWVLS